MTLTFDILIQNSIAIIPYSVEVHVYFFFGKQTIRKASNSAVNFFVIYKHCDFDHWPFDLTLKGIVDHSAEVYVLVFNQTGYLLQKPFSCWEAMRLWPLTVRTQNHLGPFLKFQLPFYCFEALWPWPSNVWPHNY